MTTRLRRLCARTRVSIAALAATAAMTAVAVDAVSAAAAPAPASATASSSAPTDPRALRYPPLSMQFPAPGTVTLSNGLVVHMLPDRDLPIVDVAFIARGGSLYDPEDKAGLALLAMHAMRTGGTAALGPDDVDERLETLPAEIHLGADDDALTGSVSCLKDRFPEALSIFAGMLRQARFDADRLESERGRVLEGIRRRWDDPGSISHLLFARLVYGEDSPWARLPTAETIGRIQRDDLVSFQRACLRPGNMALAVSGDFDPREMQRLLEKTFGDWRGGKAELPTIPKVKERAIAGVYLVERPLTQSSIAIGHLGVGRFDPDKFPLYVVNEVLGEGGFTSRLMKEVRSTRGLAYSVSGGVGSDTDRGLFEVRCRTRADATVQAIEAIRDVIRGFRDQGPTDAETQEAKDAQTNSFVFTVDGLDEYMQQVLYYERYGYPADYLRTWRDKLAAVTRADAARAAKAHLAPDGMVVLVVGNPKAFDRPLESLGLGAPKTIRLPEAGGLPALGTAAATPASGTASRPGGARP